MGRGARGTPVSISKRDIQRIAEMELDYITKIAQEPLYRYQYGADKLVESMSFHDVEHLVISMLIMHEASQDFYSSGEFFNRRVIENKNKSIFSGRKKKKVVFS